MKKLFLLIAAALVTASSICAAPNEDQRGTVTLVVTWHLDSEGIIEISAQPGTGQAYSREDAIKMSKVFLDNLHRDCTVDYVNDPEPSGIRRVQFRCLKRVWPKGLLPVPSGDVAP